MLQQTIIEKHLKSQEPQSLRDAWKLFKSHFHDTETQENIRSSNEEQYQEGFLRDLFVKVLGYTLNPQTDYNLTTEHRNVTDSKKADGAILINEEVKAVIELKGTETTDLDKVEDQAFGYKNHQKDCRVVITSNFEKLRLYIDNATEHREYNLFTLTEKKFREMYLMLAYSNFSSVLATKIKDESISEEDDITKQLYKDYSVFKRKLFDNLCELNPDYEPLTLFEKSQKLLDRFLFLFFAEDRGLLPPNAVRLILIDWEKLKKLDAYVPLIDRFRKYFSYLNHGYKGERYDIFPYNGGMFQKDEVLDNVKVDDEVLYEHTKRLSEYNFESEVDVNILGHIFENSLTEIEEVRADLEDDAIDTSQSKRKKDGVFYTPKYITKYIVDNTVGKLCEEKKKKLDIKDENYAPKKGRHTSTKEERKEKLDQYRKWLLEMTICDPACGSGAFLNQALDFLIKEHDYVNELEAKLLGESIVFNPVENSILENNLFGVDINEESVEIAKLSLWLRTARPQRKLNDLNQNIKCGNSLIDDPEIAGEKAFNWKKEFPTVFTDKEKEAFHVVITTHNSRTSKRMRDMNIKKGKAVNLNLEEEIQLTAIIGEIITEYEYDCIAFNICKDHAHLVLVCEESELSEQVKIIRGKSSYLFNRNYDPRGDDNTPRGLNPLEDKDNSLEDKDNPLENTDTSENDINSDHSDYNGKDDNDKMHFSDYDPAEHDNHLWSQKFYPGRLQKWDFSESSDFSGIAFNTSHLRNTIKYVRNNRHKHDLPESEELESIIAEFITDPVDAFAVEDGGGFDVVIGNPPYVQLQKIKNVSRQLEQMDYETFKSTGDLYCIFYEKGIQLLKEDGLLGYITSNKWMRANYGKILRKYFTQNTNPYRLLDLGAGIFTGAVVDSNILLLQKGKGSEFDDTIQALKMEDSKDIRDFSKYKKEYVTISPRGDDVWEIISKTEQKLIDKIESRGTLLKDWDIEINYGIKTGFNDAFVINDDVREKLINEDPKSSELIKPMLRGRDVQRYTYNFSQNWLITTFPAKEINIDEFPSIKSYLQSFGKRLQQIGETYFSDDGIKVKTRKSTGNKWYETQDTIGYFNDFKEEKILYREISSAMNAVYIGQEMYTNNKNYVVTGEKLLYLLAIFNSTLFNSSILSKASNTGGKGKTFMYQVKIPKDDQSIIDVLSNKSKHMLSLNKDLQNVTDKLLRSLDRKYDIDKPRKKLRSWYELSFKDFIKEVNKDRRKVYKSENDGSSRGFKKLTLKQEAEWEDYFDEEKEKGTEILNVIQSTDAEIDRMVYDLYGLTEEEIAVVEESVG